MLIAVYFMLRDKVSYKELGAEYLEKMTKDKQVKRYLQRLKELGIEVEIQNVA